MQDRLQPLSQAFLDHFNYLDAKGNKNENFFVSLFKKTDLGNEIKDIANTLKGAISGANTLAEVVNAIVDAEVHVYMRRLTRGKKTVEEKEHSRTETYLTSQKKGKFEACLVEALTIAAKEINQSPQDEKPAQVILCLADRIAALPKTVTHLVDLDSETNEIAGYQYRHDSNAFRDFLLTGKCAEGYSMDLDKSLDSLYIGLDITPERLDPHYKKSVNLYK